jgi:hypothetical protein
MKGWAARLRHRHIGNFENWKNRDDYQQTLSRLFGALKAQTQKMGPRGGATNGG